MLLLCMQRMEILNATSVCFVPMNGDHAMRQSSIQHMFSTQWFQMTRRVYVFLLSLPMFHSYIGLSVWR